MAGTPRLVAAGRLSEFARRFQQLGSQPDGKEQQADSTRRGRKLGRSVGFSVAAAASGASPGAGLAVVAARRRAARTTAALNPAAQDLSGLKAHLMLLHGRSDNVIPYTESLALALLLIEIIGTEFASWIKERRHKWVERQGKPYIKNPDVLSWHSKREEEQRKKV